MWEYPSPYQNRHLNYHFNLVNIFRTTGVSLILDEFNNKWEVVSTKKAGRQTIFRDISKLKVPEKIF